MDSSDLWNFFVCGVANIFDKEAIWEHFQYLCGKVDVQCEKYLAAAQTGDWVTACSEWSYCRVVIKRSKEMFDRDDWLWLTGCHALVWANLCAFHSMNYRLAFLIATLALKARNGVQKVREALDFKSCVQPTLWKIMYLWASTSGCEEKTLEESLKSFFDDALGYSGSVSELKLQCEESVNNNLRVSTSSWEEEELDELLKTFLRDVLVHSGDVTELKLQCKNFVTNKSKSVLWELQKSFFHYNNIECVRWIDEGNKLYEEKYPGKLDYVSKFNKAAMFFMTGVYEKGIPVLEEIRDDLEMKPRSNHPAALYCTLQYAFLIRQMLCMCYELRILHPGERRISLKMIDHANKEKAKCNTLWARIQSDGILLPSKTLLAIAWEHALNKRWKKAERCVGTSRGQSVWGKILVGIFRDKLLTDLKIKYRRSYERGSPVERYFISAGEMIKSNYYHVWPHSQWRSLNLMKAVRLHHEKDRQVMFLRQSPDMANEREKGHILDNAREAVQCYVRTLVQHTKSDEYWIFLQGIFKDLYYMLQFHNFSLWIETHECTLDEFLEFPDRLQQLWNRSLLSERVSMQSEDWQEIWKQSLLWAERRVGKTVYFQLAPNMLSSSATKQLRKFDINDEKAWTILKTSRAACGPGTVVLEYSVSKANDLQFVYVMTKDKVFTQILKIDRLERIFWLMLEWMTTTFHWFSEGSHKCNGAFINVCLEWMYELLISPVANFLADMKQEDKLIIVAPEILSVVPFAALRKPNSPSKEGYLVQSHTLSVTPSLRMLQHCNERWKELKQDILDSKPGTIVAVGDPACADRLEATGEEVDFIEGRFGKEHVKKLVGAEATPSEVLKWAKYPSENRVKRVKQVIFHIAAHGSGADADRNIKQGAIFLARPASSCQVNYDSMVDVEEETQMSSHGEVGGIRTEYVVPISEDAPDTLKAENISGCGFQWRAHMVVLSACDTARGQITGEGVLNLPRALLIAGVPSVVVSQWKVGDRSTCKLMKGFYKQLRSGKDVSSSLRAAMIEMIKEDDKVHEWAPFFVCGLPTVNLPEELQGATSSCEGHKIGTSKKRKRRSSTASHRKAKLSVKKMKVELLHQTDNPIMRLFQRAHSNPDTCWFCLEKFGKAFGLINEDDEKFFRMMQNWI